MLNINVFGQYFVAMRDRFRVEDSTHLLEEVYYEALSGQMSDQEFVTAVKRVIAEDQFFPTAEAIAAKVKGNPDVKAMESWEAIVKAASRARKPEVDEAALKALRAIGGVRQVEMAEADQLVRLRKEFIQVHRIEATETVFASQSVKQLADCNGNGRVD